MRFIAGIAQLGERQTEAINFIHKSGGPVFDRKFHVAQYTPERFDADYSVAQVCIDGFTLD